MTEAQAAQLIAVLRQIATTLLYLGTVYTFRAFFKTATGR